MASAADIEQKRIAYEQYKLTTHWPAMNIRLFDNVNAVGKGYHCLEQKHCTFDSTSDMPCLSD